MRKFADLIHDQKTCSPGRVCTQVQCWRNCFSQCALCKPINRKLSRRKTSVRKRCTNKRSNCSLERIVMAKLIQEFRGASPRVDWRSYPTLHTEESCICVTNVVLISNHSWVWDNFKRVLPELGIKITVLLLMKSSSQIKITFAFHFEINVLAASVCLHCWRSTASAGLGSLFS